MDNSDEYGKIYSDTELKEILFDLVNFVDSWRHFGTASVRGTANLIYDVGNSNYYSSSKNTGIAKDIRDNDQELYTKLQPFFHQNTPE